MQLFTNYFVGTGVIGHTALFFAICVSQIRIWCIFIAQRYASTVCAIVVCLSVQCGCSVHLVAHAVGESILCCEGWWHGSSQMTLVSICSCCCNMSRWRKVAVLPVAGTGDIRSHHCCFSTEVSYCWSSAKTSFTWCELTTNYVALFSV